MAEENKQDNKVFLVDITETFSGSVAIEAASFEEAQKKINELIYDDLELRILELHGHSEEMETSLLEKYESIADFKRKNAGETVNIVNADNKVVTERIPHNPKDWDFSQFTEEQYNYYIRSQVELAEQTIKNNEGKSAGSDELEIIRDIEFTTPNNSMFIKYKDLYIVPRIWGNGDQDLIELAFDAYIPKKHLSEITNKNVFANLDHFDPGDLKRNIFVNPSFIEKHGDELIATECIHVDIGTVAFLDEGVIKTENILPLIKKELLEINPDYLFRNLKPYLDERAKLDKASSKKFGTGLTEDEFYALADSGVWGFDKNNYRKVAEALAHPEKDNHIEEGTYLGSVGFGHDFFDMQVYEDQDEPGKYVCEMRKNSPKEGSDFNEIKNFKLYALSVDELYDNYVNRDFSGCALLPISSDNMDIERQEKFKEAVTEWLLLANEIDFDRLNHYMRVQRSANGFLEQLKKRELSLTLLNSFRREFPSDIVNKEKLTIEDVNTLADYYVGICALVTGVKETVAADRLMLKEMINDGLSDQRILMVANKMKDVKVDEAHFAFTYTKHFDAVAGLTLQDDCIKDFRKKTEKKKLHSITQEKSR